MGGGVRKFAELVGEPIETGTPRRKWGSPPSELMEARIRVLREERRQSERHERMRPLNGAADVIRNGRRLADRCRSTAAGLGDSEHAWALLALAYQLEAETASAEAQLDQVIAEDRRR